MVRSFILIFCLIGSLSVAYTQPGMFNSFGKVYVAGQFEGYPSKQIMVTNQNIQKGRAPVDTIVTDEKGKFVWDSAIPFEDFFILNFKDYPAFSLVLQAEDSLYVYGDVNDLIGTVEIKNSKDNQLMVEYLRAFTKFKTAQDSLTKIAKKDPSRQLELNEKFRPLAEEFVQFRSKLIAENGDSPAIAATLNSFDQKNEWKQYTEVIQLLNQSFSGSPTLQRINKYVEQKNQQIKSEKEQMVNFQPGKVAPEIAVPDRNGDTIRLSDLRGKVVLIDFWASWCKPCRMENPNVVKAYNKYKDDGFTVFSVSLDNPGKKEAWLNAIEQDGLIWPNHGSELKGWKSKVAQQYMVKGIPYTVLIDKEGKIIGTRIRGPKLEERLKAIFGH